MKIFISWSGDRSRQVADLLAKWIPEVLQDVVPWVSTENLDKGRVWSERIFKELNESKFGISCLTKENRDSPWLLFEAGALSKGLGHNFVCPIVIDLDFADVGQPLAAFNMTKPTKDDMFKLIRTINSAKGENALPAERVNNSFERCWKEFEEPFKKILAATPPNTAPSKRSPDEVVAELLQLSRATHAMTEQLIGHANRVAIMDSLGKHITLNYLADPKMRSKEAMETVLQMWMEAPARTEDKTPVDPSTSSGSLCNSKDD